MGLIITNALTESTGDTNVVNAYGLVVFNTDTLQIDGLVKCFLSFYRSQAGKVAGDANLYIIEDAAIVSQISFSIAPGEIVKVGANCTIEDVIGFFYTKVKGALITKYGWTINIV